MSAVNANKVELTKEPKDILGSELVPILTKTGVKTLQPQSPSLLDVVKHSFSAIFSCYICGRLTQILDALPNLSFNFGLNP